jgi:hypothetical protein
MERDEHEELLQLKLEKLIRLEEEAELARRLPHKYAGKFYPWQREWFDCVWKEQCLTAANQVGKSSTMIRKCIEWATNKELWPGLWPAATKEGKQPNVFWYCYPSKEMATSEFYDKWVPLLPPKDDPVYGWEDDKLNKFITSLTFIHMGVTVYFKTYGQGAEMLQAGTCYVVFCDEEIYEELISELQARVSATDGYLVFGFTATIGQPFWKAVVEDRALWPNCWVRQISLYDCQKFEDGTPTMWTTERIESRINQCTTKAEVLRRVFGRFVKDEGLRYPTFDRATHLKPYHMVPMDWEIYVGIDYGSGTPGVGHPSAIVFVAVDPGMTRLRVIRTWRGDGRTTTAEDVVDMYETIAAGVPQQIVAAEFDYAAADLGTIASRRGLPFRKADKSKERGVPIINGLFKTGSMLVFEPSDESRRGGIPDEFLQAVKIATEAESLGVAHTKATIRGAVMDDLLDALRYAVVRIPLMWEREKVKGAEAPAREITVDEMRRNPELYRQGDGEMDIEGEIEFWNSILDS